MRTCPKCEVEKPPSGYGVDKNCTANGGRKYVCKECTNAKRRGKYRAENRKYHLKSKYGITPAEYGQIYAKQGGACAICLEPGDVRSGGSRAKDSTRLYIDHDHVSNEVRGLLCHKCNVAIGLLFDDPMRMERAAAYIRGLPVEYMRIYKCA